MFSLNLKTSRFICNKASLSFSMFRKVCISSLMNAQSRLKSFCYSRKAFSVIVSDFLTAISVGTHHFVSSICSQKYFWFSYTSVDYSFACLHIPIPLSLLFCCWICPSGSSWFCFPLTLYLYLLCDCFCDITPNCCFMCCQQWNIIHKSLLFWNSMKNIHLFLSLQQMWKESEWLHHQATWRIKEIINSFILFFTAISQSYLRGQQSFTLLLNFFASFMWTVVFCFPMMWKENIPFSCSHPLSKGSSLNVMQSLPVGTSHSW